MRLFMWGYTKHRKYFFNFFWDKVAFFINFVEVLQVGIGVKNSKMSAKEKTQSHWQSEASPPPKNILTSSFDRFFEKNISRNVENIQSNGFLLLSVSRS